MIKRQSPTITQANILFFITATVTLAGSAFFQPKLGLGTNLWINEFVYILLPPLLMAKLNGWAVEDVYRFRKTSIKNNVISVLAGITLWIFVSYISMITRIFLDNKIGVISISESIEPSIYQSLLLIIGMVVLAPICEEIFFRGLIQKAYQGYSKRYGFIIGALIFGSYHILNGISEVIPASILGIGMGYLLYKTNSILTSMIFHAVANACAIALGGAFQISTLSVIPVWFHIIAIVGLCSSVVLLSHITGEKQFKEFKKMVQKDNRVSATGIIFLILSAIFLITVGVLEIIARLGIVKI